MDDKTRTALKNEIVILSSTNNGFRQMMGLPPSPIIGGMPPVPIPTYPALAPYLQALRQHADDFDRLLKLIDGLIDEF